MAFQLQQHRRRRLHKRRARYTHSIRHNYISNDRIQWNRIDVAECAGQKDAGGGV